VLLQQLSDKAPHGQARKSCQVPKQRKSLKNNNFHVAYQFGSKSYTGYEERNELAPNISGANSLITSILDVTHLL
jgi:hypothetical protein